MHGFPRLALRSGGMVERSLTTQHSEYVPSLTNEQGEGTITCPICQAVYTPSRSYAYLLQRPPIVLESALMSMCHFCFRCRRPSCPACWDSVHGICGQCTQETGLPFRLEPAPLAGASPVFASSPGVPARIPQLSLINVQPGRFQRPSPPTIDSIPTRPDVVDSRLPDAGRRSRFLEEEEETLPIVYEKRQRKLRGDVATMKTRPERRGRGRVGRSLLLVVLILVLLVALLMVSALLFAEVNTFLGALLHVDVRTELTRFWRMILYVF